jgi:HPt (histidine-containing phosphotransfer) domain-containing protein
MPNTDYESIAREIVNKWTTSPEDDDLGTLQNILATALRETAEPLEKELEKYKKCVQHPFDNYPQQFWKKYKALEERVKELESELKELR